jgi:hypothetical protein
MTDWTIPYSVGSVYRFDLQRLGWNNQQIDSLSDLDMLNIAQKMQALYLQSDFFKHLEVAAGEVLLEKEQQPHETLDRGA